MPKKVLKGLVLAITIVFITLSFSGCDQIMDLIGQGDDNTEQEQETELNDNQILLKKLFGALDKANNEIMQYAQANAGALKPGFTVNDLGNVRTRTFTNYSNADGIELTGTDQMTFNGPPPPSPGSEQTAGDMAMGFSGTITGGPYNLTLKMTRTPPAPPTYTECKVNETDMLADYQSMPK